MQLVTAEQIRDHKIEDSEIKIEGESQKAEDTEMTAKKTAKRAPKAPKEKKEAKARLLVYGLKLTAFIHWMRDKGFTLNEARHVLRSNGFTMIVKHPKTATSIFDHTLRAHLNCYPKFCKKKAEKLDEKTTTAIMALKKATPEESEVPGSTKKPKKQRSAEKAPKKAKAAAKKPGKSASPKKTAEKKPKTPKVASPKKVKAKHQPKAKDAPASAPVAGVSDSEG